jgi:hypothetical protein
MGSGHSGPARRFIDLPDDSKATTAKGVDEIILGLRACGNIPGQKVNYYYYYYHYYTTSYATTYSTTTTG